MANENDSQIVKEIASSENNEQLGVLLRYKNRIKDDSTYWQIVAAVWINAEICTPYLPYWKELFTANRRNRHKLMKKHDRKVWRDLPDDVKAYRAINDIKEIDTAISWTLNPEATAKLSGGRQVVSRILDKKNIIAYFNRRGEHEIIYIKDE